MLALAVLVMGAVTERTEPEPSADDLGRDASGERRGRVSCGAGGLAWVMPSSTARTARSSVVPWQAPRNRQRASSGRPVNDDGVAHRDPTIVEDVRVEPAPGDQFLDDPRPCQLLQVPARLAQLHS